MISNELFTSEQDTPLLSSGSRTLTRASFWQEVRRLEGLLRPMDPPPEGFIIINETDPLRFFTSLFALWDLGLKVSLPTEDFVKGIKDYGFYRSSLSFDGDEPRLTQVRGSVSMPGLDRGDMILFSSGSTGAQKGIMHLRENLLENAMAVNEVLGLASYSSITMLKPYLVSAISHFLVHYISGSHLRFLDLGELEAIDSYYDEDNACGIVGSPVHLMMAASKTSASRKPALFFSSGDFIYSSSIKRILGKFPGAVFYKAYGLAELAGRFFINRIDSGTPEAGMDALGGNIPGTSYAVREGQIYASSDYLFSGYLIGEDFVPATREHPTGDLVKQEGGRLVLSGRLSDEIKVGGNKISLKYIESQASSVLKDDIVVVIAQPHELLGNLICMVLYTQHRDKSRNGLMKQLREVLRSHELPHYYYYIDELPYTQSMKVDRKEIARNLKSLDPIE